MAFLFSGIEISMTYPIELTTSVEGQLAAATEQVALVDRSAVGRIEVTGKDAVDLLHRLSTQNLLQKSEGDIVGTVFTTDKGRIIDYVHVLFKNESLLLLVSPTNEQAFSDWIDKFTIMEDIGLKVVTSTTGMLSLIGPTANTFAEHAFGVPMHLNKFVEIRTDAAELTVLYREEFQTQFVDVIFPAEAHERVKAMLMASEVQEMSAQAFEIFRISRGIPAYGRELSPAFNPYEVNLAHAISFTKGCYLGQEVIARLDTYQKIQNELYGVVFETEDVPTEGSTVSVRDAEAGVLTSVSPELLRNKRTALAVMKKKVTKADDFISVPSGGTTIKGVVRRIPFDD